MVDSDEDIEDSDNSSLDEMFEHLEGAKARRKKRGSMEERRKRERRQYSGLAYEVRQHRNVAVLTKNYEDRLDELVQNDAVTHRHGTEWTTAKSAIDAHGQLPIYYRTGDEVTHTGIITDILLDPDPSSTEAEKFRDQISDQDTYGEHRAELDKTTYIVERGQKLDEPFPMTDLIKVSDSEPVSPGFWRGAPAYVFQRDGDFEQSSGTS